MTRLDLGGETADIKAPRHINIDLCQGVDIQT